MAASRPKVTADDVRRALWQHFVQRWAVVFEVTARPEPVDAETMAAYRRGEIRYADLHAGTPSQRRIDALLVRRASAPRTAADPAVVAAYRIGRGVPHTDAMFEVPGEVLPAALRGDPPLANGGLERLAIEVKVTRADFLGDVRNPDKQAPWRELAERHAYAVPAGLVSAGEVPAASGLIEVTFGTSHMVPPVRWTRKASRGTAKPLPLAIQLDAFYRWSRAEALARGYAYDTRRDDDPDTMRAELARLRRELGLARERVERERERADTWRTRYAALGRPVCSTCGRPVTLGRSRWEALAWQHGKEDEATCLVLRTAAVMQRDGEDFIASLIPGPEPDYELLGKPCRNTT